MYGKELGEQGCVLNAALLFFCPQDGCTGRSA